jgi:hypothetical protein
VNDRGIIVRFPAWSRDFISLTGTDRLWGCGAVGLWCGGAVGSNQGSALSAAVTLREREADHTFPFSAEVPRLRIGGAVPSLSHMPSLAWTGTLPLSKTIIIPCVVLG